MSKISAVLVTYVNRSDDIEKCVDSLLKSTVALDEIIVVDNASKLIVSEFLTKKSKKIVVIRNEVNVGAAAGRNIGIKRSSGDFILFMDDDAIADREMVRYLLEVFSKFKKVGFVQPKILDMENDRYIQGVGHDINLLTGRVVAWGVGTIDSGQFDHIHEVPMVGGISIVKRKVLDLVGYFDEEYFIPYEDSDLSLRFKKNGYKNYCYGKAKSWHRGKKEVLKNPRLALLGVTTPERAFRVARNKIIFMRKHAPVTNLLFFIFFLLPLYGALHSLVIISLKRSDMFMYYWNGMLSGLVYAIFGRGPNSTYLDN